MGYCVFLSYLVTEFSYGVKIRSRACLLGAMRQAPPGDWGTTKEVHSIFEIQLNFINCIKDLTTYHKDNI